jgi:hypothetical protein
MWLTVCPVGMGLQIGRKTGTGQIGFIRLPGFLIHFLRRNLFLERVPSFIDGSEF